MQFPQTALQNCTILRVAEQGELCETSSVTISELFGPSYEFGIKCKTVSQTEMMNVFTCI